MTGIVVRLPPALRDLDEVADDIPRHGSPRRAIRFLREAESTFQRLADFPGLGTLFDPDDPPLADLRFIPVSLYRAYLVIYRPIDGGIKVVRVLHGARDIASILAGELGGIGEDEDDGP